MGQRLKEIFGGKEENYILLFLWMREGGRDRLPERVQMVYESGCRALCVESRPYEHFGKEPWWDEMGIILNEAKKAKSKFGKEADSVWRL